MSHGAPGGGEPWCVNHLVCYEAQHTSFSFWVKGLTVDVSDTLGGKGYDPEKADYSDFQAWLQCYYVDGMKSVRDHNGRTMWFKVRSRKFLYFNLFAQDFTNHMCSYLLFWFQEDPGPMAPKGTQYFEYVKLRTLAELSRTVDASDETELISLSHNRFKVAQGKKEDKERRRPWLHWQEKGMSRPLLCLSNDEPYRHNTNTSLTSLGGQESLGKLSKEEGRQTGSRDQNTEERKGCTSKGSQIQERKDWQTPESKHSSAWKEINCS